MRVTVVCALSSQESYRFVEQSITILKAVGSVIANFKDKRKFSAAMKDLQAAHYPIPLHNKKLTAQHFRVSFLNMKLSSPMWQESDKNSKHYTFLFSSTLSTSVAFHGCHLPINEIWSLTCLNTRIGFFVLLYISLLCAIF
jgi:hypothetical protein